MVDSYNSQGYGGGNYKGWNQGKGYKKGGQYSKKNYQGQGKQQYQEKTQENESSIYNQQRPQQEHIDPYTAQMLIYRAEMYILMKYPHLIDLNKKNSDIAQKISDNSKFFIIKSFSEEDVHKAIKYNVWSSTRNGNKTLHETYKQTKENSGEVYLFFSCNASGRFVGCAKMNSEVDFEKMFMYWTQDTKWMGMFNLEWIFIKDVPFREFKDLIILMKDGERRPLTFSRDTQEVPLQEGKKVVQIMDNYLNTNTILEHFEYYDMRQENYEKNSGVALIQ